MMSFKEFLEGLPAVRLGPAPKFTVVTGEEPAGEVVPVDPKRFDPKRFDPKSFQAVPGGKVKGKTFKPKRTLGIPREKMPQVKDRPAFFKWLHDQGVEVTKILMAPIDLIRDPQTKEKRVGHAQSEMQIKKAQKFIEKGTTLDKDIIVSSDGIIFDGNHHWLGLMGSDPETPVYMVMVGLPFHQLKNLTVLKFPGVSFEEWLILRGHAPHNQ